LRHLTRIESELRANDKMPVPRSRIVSPMKSSTSNRSTDWLRRADSVARAVDLWVRRWALARLCEGNEPDPEERLGFAGGLIDGLAGALSMSESECEVAAYTYSILCLQDKDAVLAARELLSAATDPESAASYTDGLDESVKLSAFVRKSRRQHVVTH